MTDDKSLKFTSGPFKGMRHKSLENNVLLVTEYVKELGASTQAQIGARAGYSTSYAGTMLNEAVRRGRLEANNKRPRLYFEPGKDAEMDMSAFNDVGEKVHLSIYFDSSYCKKLEALSAFHFGEPHGGQPRMISMLIDQELERLTESGANLAGLVGELMRHDAVMSRLRGKSHAQGDPDKA